MSGALQGSVMVRLGIEFVAMLCVVSFSVVNANTTEVSTVGVNATETTYIMKINQTSSLSRNQRQNSRSASDQTATEKREYFPPNFHTVELILGTMKEGECGRDAGILMNSIKQKQKWAMQLFDSSPKFPVGILYGARYQLGNFDECIYAKQPIDSIIDKSTPISGKYCLADISLKFANEGNRIARSSSNHEKVSYRAKFNTTLHWAICIPSTCNHEDAKLFLENVFDLAIGENAVSITVDESKCYTETPLPFTTLEIVYGSVLGVFLVFIALATLFHYVQIRKRKKAVVYSVEDHQAKKPKSLAYEVITCFSVIRNVQKLFHTHPNELNLDCVSGIKVLSMFFIICAHGLLFLISGPVLNTDFFEQETLKVENGVFLNNPLLVDTFLLLSGFLMCRLLLLELEKRKGRINFLVIYIARYIRLTPAYIIVVGFYCTFLVRFSNGPLWNSRMSLESERCVQSWWANILYVNNYVNTQYLCMFQSWYLSVDTQLFMLAPIIIYPLWKWRKVGEFLLGLATTVTIIVPFIYTYVNKLDPTLMAYPPEVVDLNMNTYFINAYVKTHMRASSYCLGLLFGYIIHKLQFSGKKLSSKIMTTGWITAVICGLFSMFTITVFYSPDHEYSVWESSVYGSLHRVAWCLAVGWVLFCCITDNAMLINSCLTLKIYYPLSRLTYCAYLVNGIVVLYYYGTLRDPVYMSVPSLVAILASQIVFTFALAFVFCILFESPIIGIERILLRKDKARQQPQQHS